MEIGDRRYHELLTSLGNRQMPTEAKQLQHLQEDFPRGLASVARKVKEILVVDTDAYRLRTAQNALRLVAEVVACSEFRAARAQLLSHPPDLLVTSLRLEAYNGLHLVHLTEGTQTKSVVYGTYDDYFLAQEVQAAGAFCEHSLRLPRALTSYALAELPPRDRRDPRGLDRRRTLRGGRRCADL